jgi:hypothetical protein
MPSHEYIEDRIEYWSRKADRYRACLAYAEGQVEWWMTQKPTEPNTSEQD